MCCPMNSFRAVVGLVGAAVFGIFFFSLFGPSFVQAACFSASVALSSHVGYCSFKSVCYTGLWLFPLVSPFWV